MTAATTCFVSAHAPATLFAPAEGIWRKWGRSSLATGIRRHSPHHQAKSVICIAVLWRQAAPVSGARGLDLMTPRTTAGHPAGSGFGAGGVPLGRRLIVVLGVPVGAPLVHIVAHIEKSVTVRTPLADRPWSIPRAVKIVDPLRWLITPSVFGTLQPAAACLLPLCFRRKPVCVTVQL